MKRGAEDVLSLYQNLQTTLIIVVVLWYDTNIRFITLKLHLLPVEDRKKAQMVVNCEFVRWKKAFAEVSFVFDNNP